MEPCTQCILIACPGSGCAVFWHDFVPGTILQVCAVHPESIDDYRKHVPQLCKILRSLMMSGSTLSGEHDVGGITDPFLQARVR